MNADISILRAAIIEKSINLEWMMNAIISQHYFGYVKLPFLLEVLYDEYCPFALKRRVLIKICPDLQKGHFSESLGRLNTIRNYFAHCGQVVGDFATGTERVPDPRNPEKAIDFTALHMEFMRVEKEVIAVLFERFKAMGGKLAK